MVKYDAKAALNTDRSYQNPEIINQRLKTIEAMGLRAGEYVLDAGCGTGLLTELISNQVGESGYVSGVDFSQDMLDFATSRCESLGNVTLRQGSVTQLEFEDSYFDAASCIQTLLYVDEVETAITELHRVLKPCGRVAILETDWRGLVMNSPDHQLTRHIFDAWDEAVASPNLPTRLIPLLNQSGFSSIRVQPIPVLNTSYSRQGFGGSMLDFIAKNAVKQKLLDQDQVEQWLKGFFDLAEQQAFFFCVNRFLFTAVK
ncbi:MAG: methyltransferase domain-containing protein [Gammaproteobacteria bacterium]|nr:methyltransferase domain-containing protein [Gammaproteobacteria bacterium]